MLTTDQRLILKTDILANTDPQVIVWRAEGSLGQIVEWYNLPSTFIVWRTSVGIDEVMSNGFVWTEVDALAAGKARIWAWMAQLGVINPSKANVRQGIRDAFEVAAPNTLSGIQPHLKRAAKRGEKLFATGTGTTATPGALTFEGDIEIIDAIRAMEL